MIQIHIRTIGDTYSLSIPSCLSNIQLYSSIDTVVNPNKPLPLHQYVVIHDEKVVPLSSDRSEWKEDAEFLLFVESKSPQVEAHLVGHAVGQLFLGYFYVLDLHVHLNAKGSEDHEDLEDTWRIRIFLRVVICRSKLDRFKLPFIYRERSIEVIDAPMGYGLSLPHHRARSSTMAEITEPIQHDYFTIHSIQRRYHLDQAMMQAIDQFITDTKYEESEEIFHQLQNYFHDMELGRIQERERE